MAAPLAPRYSSGTVAGEAGAGGTVLLMPAWTPGGYLGVKTVMINLGNAALGLPAHISTISDRPSIQGAISQAPRKLGETEWPAYALV